MKLTQTRSLLAAALVLAAALALAGIVLAQTQLSAAPAASPFHPVYALLDESGQNVLESGAPVSTMKTCGQCHETDYIVSHSFHADLGLSNYQNVSGSWNASDGVFGQFDPLTYRYLSQAGDERLDLGTPEWLMRYGERIPGGGPATLSRDGQPLTSLPASATNPETSLLDPKTGQPIAWDWKTSGVMEMDCFLCHLENPDTAARAAEIHSGKFGWANTATLASLGIVEKNAQGWAYNPAAFSADGKLTLEFVRLQDPTNQNCATCHGEIHTDNQIPLQYSGCSLDQPQTATTGQIVAAQKISASGMNISGKSDLNRAFDIHAERALKCTDCHYSLNNPSQFQRQAADTPAYITYDPRRLGIGEYLQRPDHDFARGQSAQFGIDASQKGTMRRCESCHNTDSHASWLPYADQHMQTLDCESCHIPHLYAPALQSNDWTSITPAGEALSQCRGVQGPAESQTSLVTGFNPVLLQRKNVDGRESLTTYNLVTSWFWVYDDANGNPRPVRLTDLKAVYLQNGDYAADIKAAFDADQSGYLTASEARLDSEAKTNLVAEKLTALGLNNVRIVGQVQPYSINHNVTGSGYAVQDCEACHNQNSRVTAPMTLASYTPGGVKPEFVSETNVTATGEVQQNADGSLVYQPLNAVRGVYVFGHDRVNWVDWFGALAFVGALLGVLGHGTLRYVSSLRRPAHSAKVKRVYMYEAYERFWHWLQTVSILLLLFTGLVIHRPDIFGAFSFRYMVTVHNILAAILVLNAVLSLFWHLTTGEIKQYIPRPRGFIDDAIVQAKFYIGGIFKGEAHPFEKTPQRKMNPLQQATYFGLLNVLLPLQILTGALMWGAQQWPAAANLVGGLSVLAPFHSLVAWLFGAFVVGHVYLTTTGATPLEAMRGMVTGWEEVEEHH